jgi:aryl-alcohol dehydrogenase-like predicted oxidoreductase
MLARRLGIVASMKIGLGTAQFGLDYGVSNASGKVGRQAAQAIIDLAITSGVTVLDTAAAYGDAEATVGACVPAQSTVRIVTKLPRTPSDAKASAIKGWVFDTIRQSLTRLRRQQVDAVLVHHADDLLGPQGHRLWRALIDLRDEGLAESVGVSIYRADEIDSLLQQCVPDIVQLPINVLDQRLFRGGQLQRLRDCDVEIHGRSLFLQGLLLMEPENLPGDHFNAVRPVLTSFRQAARAQGLSPLQAAVAFARSVRQVDVSIFGVTTTDELAEITRATEVELPLPWFEPFALTNERILNPAQWPQR